MAVLADPLQEFKAKQKEAWRLFTPMETLTTPPAAHLVRFAGVRAGQRHLDVGTGTGVVAVTSRRQGAKVAGLDLTPELLVRARENASIAGVDDIEWKEGDAEALPFGDATFDVVTSQFGHIFAPRPDVATREMLRVLRPGGTIAFSTWPPEHFTGMMFALNARHVPPPPGVAPPPQWGDPNIIRERLGTAVRDLAFDRGTMRVPALSLAHFRGHLERNVGPVMRVVQMYADQPAKLAEFRKEFDALTALFYEDNIVRQDYLLTRAIKA